MADLLSNISTLQSSLARRREVARLTIGMSKAEKEVTTGLRADLFRDLGQRAAESVRLRNIVARNEGYIASNKLLNGRMEITSIAMSEMRQVADDFLALAVSGANPGDAISSELQANARYAIERIVTQANTVYQGSHIFAGIDQDRKPMQGWTQTSAATGLSPEDVMTSVIGAGPASLADVATITAEVNAVFDGTHATAGYTYEGTFYNGTAAATGQRVEARIGEGVTVSHGIQANDDGFTELMKGLSMLASIDVSKITDEATYGAYLDAAVQSISMGSQKLLGAEASLGSTQALVEETIERHEKVNDVYAIRMVDLEGVDAYEAATRLSMLQTQLEASYAVTARLSSLTFLNFLR
ncbi:flagellin N-terminal helical domain-containing protein [Seohaeicola zhoushanensis]|uniref:Flagellin n=1 Tax=Seohaeicola zhoushanensis TaxID=1569283 RepID=A0A8J3M7N3_9RHOB|nr:flagellin [Seohaeicola zhoushanensis]GHF36264.1 flagellin [Seohaeicola zhoushanensis]